MQVGYLGFMMPDKMHEAYGIAAIDERSGITITF